VKAKYLLPCSCGRKIPVDRSQAGQGIRCECGARLEVPTMRALRLLERVTPKPDAARPTRSAWGARQGLLLLGVLVILAALGLMALLHSSRPRLHDVEDLPPIRTWLLWQELRQGLQERPVGEKEFLERVTRYRRWIGVLWVVAGAGVLIMAGSRFVPQKRRRRTAGKQGSGNRDQGAGKKDRRKGGRG